MEKLSRKEFNEQLSGFREFMPNLAGWSDGEIWEMLPDQDTRYGEGENGLGDLLGDLEYKE